MKKLIILGSGGYGRTVADIARQLNYDIMFLDDCIPNYPLSSFIDYIDSNTAFIPAFGNNEFRMKWIDKIESAGASLASLIHPTAYVSPESIIKDGVVILPQALVNTDVTINRGCILNLGCIVDHGCVIEEGCHICLGAIVKAENRIEKLSKIDAGRVIEARTYEV